MEKVNTNMEIKIDYRETAIHKYFPQATIENLHVGDILIDDSFAIERKSSKDFLNSILNHHIFNQAINLNINYKDKCMIIVEGDYKSLNNTIYFSKIPNITIEGVKGAAASLFIKYSVPVFFASTRYYFVETVNKIIEKYEKNDHQQEKIVYDPAICKKRSDPKLQVLMQIPKIGFSKAKKIIAHYGNFENLTKMDRPTGISEKDIKNILEVLK